MQVLLRHIYLVVFDPFERSKLPCQADKSECLLFGFIFSTSCASHAFFICSPFSQLFLLFPQSLLLPPTICASFYITIIIMFAAGQIITLNTEGIDLLHQRRLPEAVSYFQEALRLIDDALITTLDNEPSIRIEIETTVPVLPVPLDIFSQAQQDIVSPNNMFTFYQQAFYFGYDYFISQKGQYIKIVLLYNLGLVFQAIGMTHTDKSSCFLKRARQCYKHALSLFDSLKESTMKTPFVLPTLALLVNLGYLYSHNYAHVEAKACREYVRLLLESKSSLCLPQDEEDFFFDALSYSMTATCNLAPAA